MRKVDRNEVPDFAHLVAVGAVVGIAAAFLAGIKSGDILKAEAGCRESFEDEEEDNPYASVRSFHPQRQTALTARR